MDRLTWLCIDEFRDCWLFFFLFILKNRRNLDSDFSLWRGVGRGSHVGIESKTGVRVDRQTIPSARP